MALACAAGDNDESNTTFGTTPNPSTTPTSMSATGAMGSEDDGDDDDDGPAASTTMDTESGDPATASGDEDTEEIPSEQPTSGMYSACLDASMCVGQTTCFTITEGVDVVDGFCTTAPCSDPMLTCDPSPGGTATPICVDLLIGGMPTTGCALDCSSGKTCPAGMQCYNLADAQVCA
jgi:hypothetical protein